MKKLITLVAALFITSTALADFPSIFDGMPTQDDSWDTIRGEYTRVIFDQPALNLDNGGAISVFFGCVEGDTIRTKKMIKKCVAWERRGDDIVCSDYEHFYGVASIVSERERCLKWSHNKDNRYCLEYETYTYTHPLSYDINVHRTARGNKHENKKGRFLFTKNYTIEACQ